MFLFVSGSGKASSRKNGDLLPEDYAEIVEEEGDYSTPTSECSMRSNESDCVLDDRKPINFDSAMEMEIDFRITFFQIVITN